MAGEDTILTRVGGRPTTATIEDNTHRYANAVGGVAIGDVVYVSANDTVAKADVDAIGTMPPIGVVQSLDGDSACYVVHSGGIATGLSSLTANTQYYLSATAGGLSNTPGIQGKAFLVGIAINATDLLVCCIPRDLHVIASADEPALKFRVGGTEKAKLFINDSNNLKIRNTTSNKHIVLEANDAGTIREALRINAAVPEVVVNEGSDSLVDFRVESDNQTHMLFVDGGNDTVGIAKSTPGSTLDINGSVSLKVVGPKTSNYTIAADDYTVVADCGSGNVTLTLPSATDAMVGRIYVIKRTDTSNPGVNTLTINRNGANIDGTGSDKTMPNLDALVFQCVGQSAGWILIGSYMVPL
jgi:hypothetical protein